MLYWIASLFVKLVESGHNIIEEFRKAFEKENNNITEIKQKTLIL